MAPGVGGHFTSVSVRLQSHCRSVRVTRAPWRHSRTVTVRQWDRSIGDHDTVAVTAGCPDHDSRAIPAADAYIDISLCEPNRIGLGSSGEQRRGR